MKNITKKITTYALSSGILLSNIGISCLFNLNSVYGISDDSTYGVSDVGNNYSTYGISNNSVYGVSDNIVYGISDDSTYGVSDVGDNYSTYGISNNSVYGVSDNSTYGVSDVGNNYSTYGISNNSTYGVYANSVYGVSGIDYNNNPYGNSYAGFYYASVGAERSSIEYEKQSTINLVCIALNKEKTAYDELADAYHKAIWAENLADKEEARKVIEEKTENVCKARKVTEERVENARKLGIELSDIYKKQNKVDCARVMSEKHRVTYEYNCNISCAYDELISVIARLNFDCEKQLAEKSDIIRKKIEALERDFEEKRSVLEEEWRIVINEEFAMNRTDYCDQLSVCEEKLCIIDNKTRDIIKECEEKLRIVDDEIKVIIESMESGK